MKRFVWILLPVLVPALIVGLGSWKEVTKGPDFPKKVAGVLEHSCFGCHSTGSKNTDAVEKVDFLKWEELSKTKKISTLSDIQEVVGEGKMPPEKFLKRFPDKALSEDHRKVLTDWTKKELSALMGESQ